MSGQRHRYLKAFKSADKDGSGSLDRKELVAALASQGIPASETEVCLVFLTFLILPLKHFALMIIWPWGNRF